MDEEKWQFSIEQHTAIISFEKYRLLRVFKHWEMLTTMSEGRKKIIQQLLGLEEEYIIKLKFILMWFRQPLIIALPRSEEQTIKYIFDKIDTIINLHEEFAHNLFRILANKGAHEAKLQEGENITELSHALEGFIPCLPLYSDYISRLKKILKHISRLYQEYPQVMTTVDARIIEKNILDYFNFPVEQVISYRELLEKYISSFNQEKGSEELQECAKYLKIYEQVLENIKNLIQENSLNPLLIQAICKDYPLQLPVSATRIKSAANVHIYFKRGKILLLTSKEKIFLYVIKDCTRIDELENHILIELNFLSTLKVLLREIKNQQQVIHALICGVDNALVVTFQSKNQMNEMIQAFNILIQENKNVPFENAYSEINKLNYPYEKPCHPHRYNNVIIMLKGEMNRGQVESLAVKISLANFSNFEHVSFLTKSEIKFLENYANSVLKINPENKPTFFDNISLSLEQKQKNRVLFITEYFNKVIRHINFLKNPEFFFSKLKISEGVWRLINQNTFTNISQFGITFSQSNCHCETCNEQLASSAVKDPQRVYESIEETFKAQYLKKVEIKRISKAKNEKKGWDVESEKSVLLQMNEKQKIFKFFISENNKSQYLFLTNVPQTDICPRLWVNTVCRILEIFNDMKGESAMKKIEQYRVSVQSRACKKQRLSLSEKDAAKRIRDNLTCCFISQKLFPSWQLHSCLKRKQPILLSIRIWKFKRMSEPITEEINVVHQFREETVGHLLTQVEIAMRINLLKNYCLCAEVEGQVIMFDEYELVEDVLACLKNLKIEVKGSLFLRKYLKFNHKVELAMLSKDTVDTTYDLKMKKDSFVLPRESGSDYIVMQEEEVEEREPPLIQQEKMMMLIGEIVSSVKSGKTRLSESELVCFISIIYINEVPSQQRKNIYADHNLVESLLPSAQHHLLKSSFFEAIQRKIKSTYSTGAFTNYLEDILKIVDRNQDYITDFYSVVIFRSETLQTTGKKWEKEKQKDEKKDDYGNLELFGRALAEVNTYECDYIPAKLGVNHLGLVLILGEKTEIVRHEDYQIELMGLYMRLIVNVRGQQVCANIRSDSSHRLLHQIALYRKVKEYI